MGKFPFYFKGSALHYSLPFAVSSSLAVVVGESNGFVADA